MSVPNVVWFVPVRFDATSYVVRVTINGTTENLTFPASGSLSPTLDYWATGDNQTGLEDEGYGRADLIRRMFQATLRTHSQGASATATLSTTTWEMTCYSGGVPSIQIHWSHGSTTLDPVIFGYEATADSVAASTIVSPNRVLGPIEFGRPIADDSGDYQPVTGGVAMSLSGHVRVSRLTVGRRHRDMLFRYLLQSNALSTDEASAPSTTVEYAWIYALSRGYPIRHYTQASDVAVPVYDVYRTRTLDYPLTRDEANSVWWSARFALVRELTTR